MTKKATVAEQRDWMERAYPKTFACKFCGATCTVSLEHNSVNTRTTGHGKGCVLSGRR